MHTVIRDAVAIAGRVVVVLVPVYKLNITCAVNSLMQALNQHAINARLPANSVTASIAFRPSLIACSRT